MGLTFLTAPFFAVVDFFVEDGFLAEELFLVVADLFRAAFLAPEVYFFVTGAGLEVEVRPDFCVVARVVLALDLATDRVVVAFFEAAGFATGFFAGTGFFGTGVVFCCINGREMRRRCESEQREGARQ